MFDARWKRIGREVAIAAFGVTPDAFDPWVLDRMTELLEEQHVRAGARLWLAGEPIDSLYFMLQGRVIATREGAPPWTFDGRWLLGGFEGHLDRLPTRTLTAAGDFHAFRIHRRAWLEVLEDSFELARLSIVRSAAAVARLDDRLATGDRRIEGEPAFTVLPSNRPLTMVERLAWLTDLPLARGAGVQVLADIAAVSDEISVSEGSLVFAEGEDNDRFFVIVEGQVETTRRAPDAVRRYGAGELLTGAAAFAEGARPWNARALRKTRLLSVPIEAWFDLMEEHFDLAHSTLAVLAREREKILDRLAQEAGPEGLVLR